MINFDDYKNQLLKITFKDPEQSEPIFCLMGPSTSISAASNEHRLDPSSHTFYKFANVADLIKEDTFKAEWIMLQAEDIATIEVIKPE